MLTTTAAGNKAEKTLYWIRWADADYLGARILLMNGLLIQGTALANTAIEKYLKAIFVYSDLKIPHSHDVAVIYKKLHSDRPSTLILNQDFLLFLTKAYSLRYPDTLREGFNIALNQMKILSELDVSVLEITPRFVFVKDQKQIAMVLEEATIKQDQRFLAKNVALDPSKRVSLFSSPSFSYEIRVHNGNLHQVEFQSKQIDDNQIFNVGGFVPLNDRQFNLTYGPPV